jgi:hypothetical protein
MSEAAAFGGGAAFARGIETVQLSSPRGYRQGTS